MSLLRERVRESSLSASRFRFDLSEVNREGVRVLHRYLDFAQRGEDALDLQVGTGEFESPYPLYR
jgi:hypothetical protein